MAKLSLSMIVKNEEKHLERCLSSVKSAVDEIVIVDTGSTDKTVEIANSFGAKVFYFDWINDFSAARNFSLSKCTGNWILYLDADEILNPDSIEELLNIKNREPAGVNCTVNSPGTDTTNGSIFRYPRLFANVPGVKFSGKVHEQLLDSLKTLNLPVIESNIEIIHYGYAIDDERLNQKKERNLSLLLDADKNKTSAYDKLKLIQTLISLNRYDEAELRLNKLVNSKNLFGTNRDLAFYYLASVKYEQNDLRTALTYALKAVNNLKNKPELNYLLYLIYLRTNNLNEAIKYLQNSIKTNKLLIDNLGSFNNENVLDQTELFLRAIKLNHTINNLAKAKELILDFSEYISKINKCNTERLVSDLNDLFFKAILSEETAKILLRMIKSSNLQSLVELITTSNDKNKVSEVLTKLLVVYPKSSVLYRSLALIYIESNPDQALELLNKSLEIEKEPQVYIYLISIYLNKSDLRKAAETFILLKQEFGHNVQISPKINVLEQKLASILSL